MDQLDTKKLYFFDLREPEQEKWLTKYGFTMDGYKETKKAHWNEIKNINPEGVEPFVNGLETIGEENIPRR